MSKAKIFLASMVWLAMLGTGVALYRLWYLPTSEREAKEAEEAQILATSGESNYRYQLKLGLDGFSGYAVLRSDEFRQQLRDAGIKLETVDDAADYDQRLSRLEKGEIQLAAFPIDALVKASASAGRLPATIVALIDETRGGDAVVAYQQKYPNIDALNNPETRFVLVQGSPSDTLARVLMHSFLDRVSPQAIAPVNNEKELLAHYQKAAPAGPEVFVTWEPVVTELLKNDQMKVVFDSSQQSGYIVDALVVSRDFLLKNEPVVRDVLAAYFRTLYHFNSRSDGAATGMIELVRRDAQNAGLKLTDEQAGRLAGGIAWKHTQDNFAHFGLGGGTVTHIEDMIDRVRRVLKDTRAIESDPTGGDSSRLFNQQALRELQASGFHAGASPEQVVGQQPLPVLSDTQWDKLVAAATLPVPPLIFARGTAHLTEQSEAILDDLADQLKSFPLYYLRITGNAGSRGDPQANRSLAKQRAETALQYLHARDVPASRMRADAGETLGEMSVTFRLVQVPY